MPIKRLREPNSDEDKDLVSAERRRPGRRPRRVFSPQKAILFAKIADLKSKSATKMLEASKSLIEQSRRLILETELSVIKDD